MQSSYRALERSWSIAGDRRGLAPPLPGRAAAGLPPGLAARRLLGAVALVLVVADSSCRTYDDKEVHEVRAGFPGIRAPREAPRRSRRRPGSPAPAAPVLLSSGGLAGHRTTTRPGPSTCSARPTAVTSSSSSPSNRVDARSGLKLYVRQPDADREDTRWRRRLLGGLQAPTRATCFYDGARPTSTPREGDWTVLVWCRAFGVPIANATLTA